jgi:hypothetical protein
MDSLNSRVNLKTTPLIPALNAKQQSQMLHVDEQSARDQGKSDDKARKTRAQKRVRDQEQEEQEMLNNGSKEQPSIPIYTKDGLQQKTPAHQLDIRI